MLKALFSYTFGHLSQITTASVEILLLYIHVHALDTHIKQ